MLIFYILLLIMTLFFLANLWRGFSLAENVLTWFLLITADIVLVMEAAGLLGVLNRPAALILIQLVLTLIGFAVNRIFRIGYPKINPKPLRNYLSAVGNIIRSNKLLSLFAVLVQAVYVFEAILTIRFPQNLSDNLYNHLSRIGFWLQQGSLKHYTGFSPIGTFYPYNNSLLATLPIVFLKTDRFVGLVQYSAAIMAVVAIYLLAEKLGFSRKSSAIVALLFLTYPIILFEAITVQNDLLAACFCICAFAFLVTGFEKDRSMYLIISTLSLALALGTNQYTLFALPGYALLLMYYIFAKRQVRRIWKWLAVMAVFTLLVGSYSYLQNAVVLGNPLGPKGFLQQVVKFEDPNEFLSRARTNSARLFAQFISCDGLPPGMEITCLKGRASILGPLLPKNIESTDFLYDVERFSLTTSYNLNAESAWFGPISWAIILPGLVLGIVRAFRRKKWNALFLLIASFLFFCCIAVVKHGWDPYQGRYLITAVVLAQPVTAALFDSKKVPVRVFTGLVCAMSAFVMLYAVTSNQTLPTLTRNSLKRLYAWGKENNSLVQKVAYKLIPLAKYDKDVWKMTSLEVKTFASHDYYFKAVSMVEASVPSNASLGIAVDQLMFFDYLFRGEHVSRVLTPLIVDGEPVQSQDDFILIAPLVHYYSTDDYQEIGTAGDWILWEKIR